MHQLNSGLSSTLDDFKVSLARISHLAEAIFNNTSVDPEAIELNETQQSGCTVLLTGFFEEFLKSIIREYLTAIPRTGIEFVSLDEKVKRTHFEGGGRVLAEVVAREAKKKPQFFSGIKADDVVARLYSPADDRSSEYFIVWEAFADTKQSPGVETVADLLKGLGLSEVWPRIHTVAERTALDARLRDLIEKRNECAHTGRNNNVPSPSQIVEYGEALELIASAITSLLKESMDGIPCGSNPYIWR